MSDKSDLWGISYRDRLNLGDYAHQLSRGIADPLTVGHKGIDLDLKWNGEQRPPLVPPRGGPGWGFSPPQRWQNISGAVQKAVDGTLGGGMNQSQQDANAPQGEKVRGAPSVPGTTSGKLPPIRIPGL